MLRKSLTKVGTLPPHNSWVNKATVRHTYQRLGQALPCTGFPHYGHPYRKYIYLDILAAIGVLPKTNRSEWDASSFIISKKDGRVKFISNFRLLNKQIKRTPYPLTHIKDMLNKLSNFTCDMTLYLIMGYYNISLTDAAKKACTITITFGNCEFNRLPMGVCIAPGDLEFYRVYIANFLVVASGSLK